MTACSLAWGSPPQSVTVQASMLDRRTWTGQQTPSKSATLTPMFNLEVRGGQSITGSCKTVSRVFASLSRKPNPFLSCLGEANHNGHASTVRPQAEPPHSQYGYFPLHKVVANARFFRARIATLFPCLRELDQSTTYLYKSRGCCATDPSSRRHRETSPPATINGWPTAFLRILPKRGLYNAQMSRLQQLLDRTQLEGQFRDCKHASRTTARRWGE